MYSVRKNVQQVVALLCAHGIKNVIVCAGSRSSPLAHTLAQCPDLVTHPCVDERSGAFEALGMIQATGMPAAICVTSGSALLDASPALAEAYYQELPLILISADRPAAWIDQMDGQTMRQAGALSHVVKKSVDLPMGESDEELWHANRLVNEALVAATAPAPGPVHINVPLAEPLFDFSEPSLPEPRVITRVNCTRAEYRPNTDFSPGQSWLAQSCGHCLLLPEEIGKAWNGFQRILILVGQMPSPKGEDTASWMQARALDDLRSSLRALAIRGCVVVCEHLANLVQSEDEIRIREDEPDFADELDDELEDDGYEDEEFPRLSPGQHCLFVDHMDMILTRQDKDLDRLRQKLAPDLVVTLGGHLVSKRLKNFLRSCPPFEHWHVSADGKMPDLFRRLTRVLALPPHVFAAEMHAIDTEERDRSYEHAWDELNSKARHIAREKNDQHCRQPEAAEEAPEQEADSQEKGSPKKDGRSGRKDFADLWIMGAFLSALPWRSIVHLGNSSPVRNAQYWSLPADRARVLCNRGVNGIDGSLSAALGAAIASPHDPVFCCLGDLSFFYDVNGLWRTDLPKNLRVLLFNNGEGNIFRALPGLASPWLISHIAGSNTFTARPVAENAKMRYFSASTWDEFFAVLPKLVDPKVKGARILEVFTKGQACTQALKEMNKALQDYWHAHPFGEPLDAKK